MTKKQQGNERLYMQDNGQDIMVLRTSHDLSIKCCQLTRPSLDKGNAECRKSLNLPAHRKFNFAELYTINMCIEECNYIGCGYIEIDPPFRLDLANIRINLQTIAPQPQNESIPFLVDAYRKCELFRSSHGRRFTLHLPDIEFIEEPCNPFALQVTICVRIHAMQKCPSEFYVDSEECRLAREYFTQCVGDIESNLA
ncbi:Odorant-binding protein 85a [Drosophila erecta]|nr:Odorant-binding protein 85a [Drosophila erecta]